jgi:hypothetical protein
VVSKAHGLYTTRSVTSPITALPTPLPTKMHQLANLPHDKYLELSDFIIHCIEGSISADGDGVEGKTLVQLCQEHFDEPHLPNDQSARQERDLILAALKRMVREEKLESTEVSERVVFKFHPSFNMEDPKQDKENRPIEGGQAQASSKAAIGGLIEPEREPQTGYSEAHSQHFSFSQNGQLLTSV